MRFVCVVSAVSMLVSTSSMVACLNCRPATTRPLNIDCAVDSTWRGELHLDSAATWRSFLTDQCLIGEAPEVIDAMVDAVDFTSEAVVVARGPRAGVSRCLEAREVETVDICETGVRVVFDDVESGEEVCPGDWTVAFALPRDDLRSALLANERASAAAPFTPGEATINGSVTADADGADSPAS